MSRAAKLTLAGTSLFAISTVFFVHYAQSAEKTVWPPPSPNSPIIPIQEHQADLYYSTGNARRCRPGYGAAAY